MISLKARAASTFLLDLWCIDEREDRHHRAPGILDPDIMWFAQNDQQKASFSVEQRNGSATSEAPPVGSFDSSRKKQLELESHRYNFKTSRSGLRYPFDITGHCVKFRDAKSKADLAGFQIRPTPSSLRYVLRSDQEGLCFGRNGRVSMQ
jgi:hypothetical protein